MPPVKPKVVAANSLWRSLMQVSSLSTFDFAQFPIRIEAAAEAKCFSRAYNIHAVGRRSFISEEWKKDG